MARRSEPRDHHPRRLGHRACPRPKRRRRGVRDDLCPGRGRLPADRGQLPDRLGRTAEAEGEKAIWQDLRARLYVSDSELQGRLRAQSPAPMRQLMDAWADGLNYFLATHPDVHPRALTRFEPWMALSFTEGSIGGDIERIDLDQLEAFYSGKPIAAALPPGSKARAPTASPSRPSSRPTATRCC